MRSRNDLNAVVHTSPRVAEQEVYENFKIELTGIEWLMLYVVASNSNKIRLLYFVEKDRPIVMSFRTWELYDYPLLPITSRQVWTVKTSNQLEKPCFVVLGFQTNRKDQKEVNANRFDHCNLTNVPFSILSHIRMASLTSMRIIINLLCFTICTLIFKILTMAKIQNLC